MLTLGNIYGLIYNTSSYYVISQRNCIIFIKNKKYKIGPRNFLWFGNLAVLKPPPCVFVAWNPTVT